MQGVGQRVVDRLDLRVGQDVAVAGQGALNSVPLGEVLGPAVVPGRDRDQPVTGQPSGLDDGPVGDPGRTQHTDAERVRGHAAGHEACPSGTTGGVLGRW
jgi:hypothetical protein